MPTEIIGEFGTPGADRGRIVEEYELAINHLKKVWGEPPPEMELEIQWQEHDLGAYPVIVLTWEEGMRGAPWDYICEMRRGADGLQKRRRTSPQMAKPVCYSGR